MIIKKSQTLSTKKKLCCCCSVTKSSLTLQSHELQDSRNPCPSYLLEFAQIHVHWVSDAFRPSLPLSSPSSIALNISQHQGLFQWVSSSHQVAKILQLQLQHQSFQWMTRVDTFRMDWFDLLAVQGTLKSFLQWQSLKASILQHTGFFMSQLSHPYMTNGKTKALTIRTFVGKVMSLLFNILSMFLIAILPRSRLFIQCLNFVAAITILVDCGA